MIAKIISANERIYSAYFISLCFLSFSHNLILAPLAEGLSPCLVIRLILPPGTKQEDRGMNLIFQDCGETLVSNQEIPNMLS